MLAEVLNILDQCLDFYQQNALMGERLGEILEQKGFKSLFGKLIAGKKNKGG